MLFEDSGAVLAIAQAQALSGRAGEETDVVVQLAPGARAIGRRHARSNARSPAPR